MITISAIILVLIAFAILWYFDTKNDDWDEDEDKDKRDYFKDY